ncbi:MAG: ABC-F family ATP-binding cassette domain-containing protein [Deltaproteobacteria bacterium]|nr:ABC-F family ATP-binding cassette domain-containing protein [Deltaproteobacteria bacterium]
MPPILSISNLSKSYNARTLFNNISFGIESGERVALIGPNGAGKSTLLSILIGQEDPDTGEVAYQKGTRLALLAQVPQFKEEATILSSLLEAAKHLETSEALQKAYELISKLSLDGSGTSAPALSAETVVTRLSGGWQKRVALARALIQEPDLLLLDEPTNHLDVESILWLEEHLARSPFATLTVTHDRYFLQKISNRILELDSRNPQGLLSVSGNYQKYLEVKAELIANQKSQELSLKNTLRREQAWLLRGAQARSTKQQARIQRAGELAQEVQELSARNVSNTAKLAFKAEGHSPQRLLEAKHLSKSFGEKKIFEDLNLLLGPQTRLGLLGANGAGKSTLIKVLLKQLPSDSGKVFHAERLKPVYFEQNRESLDPETPITQALSPQDDQVIYQGKAMHIRGYLERFLFKKDQMQMKVGQLSGGEQSRLLLAKLMLAECNLLILDEPTNDLDLATLGILEDCLSTFEGAVILVSHDRFFMDRVATEILAFHPFHNGETTKFASLLQWETWHAEIIKQTKQKEKNKPSEKIKKATKLSYKEERELSQMEEKIHALEKELAKLTQQIQLPEVLSDHIQLKKLSQSMEELETKINISYSRWEELEKKKASFA